MIFVAVSAVLLYPSDVLGGLVADGACVTACLTAYAVAHRRRRRRRDGAV